MTNTSREAAYKRKRNAWREILYDLRGSASEAVTARRLQLVEEWRRDPWAYVAGRDVPTDADRDSFPQGKPVIWTVDERDDASPVKPFPAEKTYLKYITYELWQYKTVFIDKVRQMIITTLCAILIDWYCSFFDEREVFVSRVKEESAIKLINDKIRTVNGRKPEWLQAIVMQDRQPKNIITYGATGSTVTGVAQNFAAADARGPTGSLIFVDEAAFQEYFPQIFRAVQPMAARMWAVSTANIGHEGARVFKDLIFEGRPKIENLTYA